MVKGLCMRREQKRNEMEKDESCGHCDGRILRRTRTCRERQNTTPLHGRQPMEHSRPHRKSRPGTPSGSQHEAPVQIDPIGLSFLFWFRPHPGLCFVKVNGSGRRRFVSAEARRWPSRNAKPDVRRLPIKMGRGADTWRCLKASATSARRKTRISVLFWSAFAWSVCRQEGRDECAERTPSSTAGSM